MSGRRRIAIGLCICWPVCCLWPQIVRAEDAPAVSDELRPHLPSVEINFTAIENPTAFVYADGGRKILVNVVKPSINVWAVCVYYWPEILGGLLGLVLLAALYFVIRIRRRSRIVGMPYCRHCNYCLHGSSGPRCSECGREIHRPVMGRSFRRRALPAACVALIACAGYGMMWAFQLPRKGELSHRFDWWSQTLHQWAQDGNHNWLSKRAQPAHRIVEYDVATGEPGRTLLSLPAGGGWRPIYDHPYSNDAFFTYVSRRKQILLVSKATGRVERQLRLDSHLSLTNITWDHWAGVGASGEAVYFTVVDADAGVHHLLEWDIPANRVRSLIEGNAHSQELMVGRTHWSASSHFQVMHCDPLRFIEQPRSKGMFERSDGPRIIDPRNPSSTVELNLSEHRVIGFNHNWSDREEVYSIRYGENIQKRDLVRFDETRIEFDKVTTIPRGFDPMVAPYIATSEGDFVLLSASWELKRRKGLFSILREQPRVFLVYRLDESVWQGLFALPDDWSARELRVAPDGRSFAALGWAKTAQPGGSRNQILIYDLTTLPHDVNWQFD